jgi:hypothetical protein
VKHLDKALIGAGVALLLSGGVAAAALGPSNVGSIVMSSLPGDVTLAANNHGLGGMNFMSTAATYIGITEAQLRTELQSGKSLADVAVAHGKTRDGLIAALVQASTNEITTLVDQKNPFPAPPAGAPGFGFRVEGNELAAAATYLGITEADLRTKLQAGSSLAQIAAATSGKSRDGLIQALVADATKNIDAAQSAGKITADQATKLKTDLTQRITQMVDATRPAGGPGFGPGPRGRGFPGFPGFPGAPRPSASPSTNP